MYDKYDANVTKKTVQRKGPNGKKLMKEKNSIPTAKVQKKDALTKVRPWNITKER